MKKVFIISLWILIVSISMLSILPRRISAPSALMGSLVLQFDTESDYSDNRYTRAAGVISADSLDANEQIGVVLSSNGLKATFFVQGACFTSTTTSTSGRNFTEIIQELHSSGFEIASHTYTHIDLEDDYPNNFAYLETELNDTAWAIYRAIGNWPQGFRAPYWRYGHEGWRTGNWTNDGRPLWNHLIQLGHIYDSSKRFNVHPSSEPHNFNPYRLQGGLFELPPAIWDIFGTNVTDFDAWRSCIDAAINGETRILAFHPQFLIDDWSSFLNIIEYIKERQDGGFLQTLTAAELAESAGATFSSVLTVHADSSANLMITNHNDNRIGYNNETGLTINEIVGATYSGPETEPQVIIIPSPVRGIYIIDRFGTDTGPYTITIKSVASNGTARAEMYPVQVTSNGTILNFSETSGSLRLEVSGETGTSAYAQIIQPVSLNSTRIKAFLNNTRLTFPSNDPQRSISTNGTHYFIYITIAFNSAYELILAFPILGDVNYDGIVELMDFWITSQAFGSSEGDPNWNPHTDLNEDAIVDLMDFFVLSENLGKEWNYI